MCRKPIRQILALCAALALLAGCGGPGAGSSAPADELEPAVSEPAASSSESAQAESGGVVLSFEARDVDGNAVTSDLFAQSRLTVLNVWGTYCEPCLSEMPGLGELAQEYDPEQVQVVGLLCDVSEDSDQEMVDYAKQLIEATGASYTHLVYNNTLFVNVLAGVTAVPTTLFVDSSGRVLGAVAGAQSKQAWEAVIDGLLEQM